MESTAAGMQPGPPPNKRFPCDGPCGGMSDDLTKLGTKDFCPKCFREIIGDLELIEVDRQENAADESEAKWEK